LICIQNIPVNLKMAPIYGVDINVKLQLPSWGWGYITWNTEKKFF